MKPWETPVLNGYFPSIITWNRVLSRNNKGKPNTWSEIP